MRKEGMCVIAHSKCHLQLRLQISQPAPCRSPAEGCQGAADSLASSCIKVQQLQNMHNKTSSHFLTFVLLSETAPALEILGLCFFFSYCPASLSHYPHSQQENKFVRFGGKYQECRESVNVLPNLFYFLSFFIHFSGESGDLIRPRTETAPHKLTVYMHTCIIMGPSGLPSGRRKPSCLLPSAEPLCNATLLLPCFCHPEFGHLSTHCITKIKSRRETEADLQHKHHADSTSYRTVLFT